MWSVKIKRSLFLLGFAVSLAVPAYAENKSAPAKVAVKAAPAAVARTAPIAPGAVARTGTPAATVGGAPVAGAKVNPAGHTQVAAHAGIGEHREIAEVHREMGMREHHEFHERDVHRFDRAEFGRWRGGRWHNSCFGGRCGWWWLAGGQWYFYEQPVYPYPMAVSEVLYLEPVVAAPAVVIAAPAPVMRQAPMEVSPTSQTWYYCSSPAGYYPSVPSCPAGWQEVGSRGR